MNSLTIGVDIIGLKNISLNRMIDFSKRKKAIDQLSRIPHKDKNKHIIDCLLSMISDDKYQIEHRYNLFCNNNFENDVLKACYLFYFNNFHPPRYPIRLKVLSAQYILQNIPQDQYDLREVRNFLAGTYHNTSIEGTIRTECLHILNRSGFDDQFVYDEHRFNNEMIRGGQTSIFKEKQDVIHNIINKLPESKKRILRKRKDLYEDGQNVHTTAVNESVKEIIRKLYNEFGYIFSIQGNKLSELNEVSKKIIEKTKLFDLVQRQRITGSFDRIMTDTSKFENDLGLSEVLVLVWKKIKTSKDRDELENRLVDELQEMNGLCATGHLSRLINTIGGFFEDMNIKISYKDQIKNYIYNHYNKVLNSHERAEEIINEMTEDMSKKQLLMKMIETNSNKNDLFEEFVTTKLVNNTEFEEYYKSAINSYCGLS